MTVGSGASLERSRIRDLGAFFTFYKSLKTSSILASFCINDNYETGGPIWLIRLWRGRTNSF
jgi:hypothetical protein